ncbi:MAG: T9SS type A sorting domain-containing protein [Ignavibacteria bacterium]|nr:T9SS type A sorting domain-containing protein [Ignavibacteria bacterium]
MLLSENEPIKILGFENNDLGGGAHVVNVIKVEKDKTNPKVFNVYIYDNREPDSSSIIKINTLENNGNGTWFYSSLPDWGGDSLFYLIDPSISYLSNPSFDNINNNKKTIALYDTLIQIFNQESQDILIYDNLGNNSGFVNDTLFRNIPNSTADIIPSGIKLAPYSYTLTPGEYSILLKGFKSETIQLGLFTGNKSFSYERYNATSSQTDKLNFDDGVSVSNPDPEVKTISLLNIQDETTHDKLFAFSSLEMAQNDSVKIENLGSDNFKLISYGSTKNYDIELNYVSQLELGRFINANIDLPSNSSHIFVPEWNNVTNSQLVILEDLGNNGTIDDTLRVNNIITNTEEEFVPLPDKYFLAQNYPNPFNPSTLIKYEIKNDAMVTLKVYNILGKEVASLVNEIKRAGRYEIEFNGSNLSSGIYYYRLDAGEFSETRKMLLIK